MLIPIYNLAICEIMYVFYVYLYCIMAYLISENDKIATYI